MPGIGNNFFGIYPDLAKEQSNILQYGINLFQLIYPVRVESDISIFGPFGLKVDEPEMTSNTPISRTKRHFYPTWYFGGDAKAIFVYDRAQKIAIGWVPDDPPWHNRLVFMDTPWLLKSVTQMRTRDNKIISGAEVQLEVKCLEAILKEDIKIFNVVQEGKRQIETTCKSSKEAKDYIEDQVVSTPKIQPDGTIVPIKRKRIKYEIQEETARDYRPEIKDLIEKEMPYHKFGWTECQTFQKEIKPQVIELIKKEREKATFPDMQQGKKLGLSDIAQILSSLSDEEKAFIQQATTSTAKNTENADAEEVV